jgi:2-dehydro-3-deoxyphosphogluconate aldolase/(4S)-4-hydroxy-2-oxoglutarate aldolase
MQQVIWSEDKMTDSLQTIEKHRLVIIYRGMSSEQCLEISRALMDAGVRLFEVTMNSPDTTRTIASLKTELGVEALVGAGTVTEASQVDMAADSGASYIISPNTNLEVIRRTKERGLISIPGAFSPTEVQSAREAGADIVKIFPISIVGARYITQIRGPLGDIPFMPSGGITLELAEELTQVGVAALGVGVHLLGKDLIESRDWNALRKKATELVRVSGARVPS